MPLKTCSVGGKPGWKYGDSGHCYPYTEGDDASEKKAKQQAVKQAVAIGGGSAPSDLSEQDFADAGVKTKVCTNCGKTRIADRFSPDQRTSDGLSAVCVHCRFDTERNMGELETVNLTGVPILGAGGPFFGSGSPEEGDNFDVGFLHELADAHLALRDEVRVPIKIGHSNKQKLLKNSGLSTDEQPAAGWVENLRVAGDQLLADLRSVPKKLADLIKVGAFRTRSVELSPVTSQTMGGKEFDTVVTGLALLGAKAPAVRTLDDILSFYSERNESAEVLLAEDETDPKVTRTVDLTWDTNLDGKERNPATKGDTKNVATTQTSPFDSLDLSDEQIQKFAAGYGITEEDDAKRREAVMAKLSETPGGDEGDDDSGDDSGDEAGGDTTTPAATKAKADDSKETVTVSASELAELREKAEQGAKAFANQNSGRIEGNLQVALRQNRIKPADVDKWRKDYAEGDYEMITRHLLALPIQPGLTKTYGSDESDTDPHAKREDSWYREYAARTNVPVPQEAKS